MTPEYLESLRESMDLAVQDLAEAGREWESACMRQAAEAIDRLRRQVRRAAEHLRTVGNDYPGSSCQAWCEARARELDLLTKDVSRA